MRAKQATIIALVVVSLGYLTSPYLAIWEIESAVRQGDPVLLSRLINWGLVRDGIKEDICDLVLETPSDPVKKGELPPFGSSFVRGVTGTTVDREFTAESLAGIARPSNTQNDDVAIKWAFFSTPLRFSVYVGVVGEREPIKVEMTVSEWRWKVVRVWIPPNLLTQGKWRV